MHHVNDCPTARNFFDVSHEQVNAAFSCPGNDPYSNTYNLGWRSHPNFWWKAQALDNSAPTVYNQAQSNKQPYHPSSIYRPPQRQSQATPSPRSDFDFQNQMLKLVSGMNQIVNFHSQAIAKLEAQMGQIANTLNMREDGKLPSQLVMWSFWNVNNNTTRNSTNHCRIGSIERVSNFKDCVGCVYQVLIKLNQT
jgi:hypothetical protein